MERQMESELDWNLTMATSNHTKPNPYTSTVIQIVANSLFASCFLYYILPFVLCFKMTTPLMNIFKIISKPSYKGKHLMAPSFMILLPIISFVLVAIGYFMLALAFLGYMEEEYPGSSSLLYVNLEMFGTDFHFL